MKVFIRRILVTLALCIPVVGIFTAGGYLWLRQSLPQASGEISVTGLGSEAQIIRDENGFATIRAKNELDAAFALGFAHAQDRIWQMDFWRRTASGRLSEVIGESTLKLDRFLRTLGLARIAEENFEGLSVEVRQSLEAYAAGVNAYLETHDGPLSPAFLLLGYEPEPWRPADSVIWGRLMALQLSNNWRDELRRGAAEVRLSPEMAADLWRRSPEDEAITLGAAERELLRGLPLMELANALPPSLHPKDASNAWALSGTRTQSGLPILANDPHLELSAPGFWYMTRIETPTLVLTGATAPGVPFLILGHNGKMAWGLTTTHSDTQDLYIERISGDDPSHYLTPDGTQAFETREEIIEVKDAQAVRMTVRATRHGPVISDVLEDRWESKDGRVLALSWPALRGDDRTVEAFYRLNRAHGWESFRSALRDFHSPQQNVLYADSQGTIAFLAPARVPIRREGDGRRPVPGWTDRFDWTEFIPFEELPQSVSPPGGALITANNRVVGDDYPYLITADWPDDFRARRIEAWLAANGQHSPEKASELQLDILSGAAGHLLPLLLSMAEPREAGLADALDLLGNWDYTMNHKRPEPLLFYAWMAALNELLVADELGDLWPEFQRPKPEVLFQILKHAPAWCDDGNSPEQEETCIDVVTRALEHAISYIERRFDTDIESARWGLAHRAAFTHPIFSQAPFLSDFVSLAVEAPGGDTTINRGGTEFKSPHTLFLDIHGSGLRAIYDLADLDQSLFMIATGQSGNPLSSFYGNMVHRWRDGQYTTFGTLRGETGVVLTLAPR